VAVVLAAEMRLHLSTILGRVVLGVGSWKLGLV
jgi:hypothetical protein